MNRLSVYFCWVLLCSCVFFRNLFCEKVLVTGCGRSGTTYTGMVFQKAGYDVDHEMETGSFGTVSWKALFPSDRKRQYDVILHQIRDPRYAIASLQTLDSKSWDFICQRVPEITRNASLHERCAAYWVYWNRLAAQTADHSFPLEKMKSHLKRINALLGTKIYSHHLQFVSDKTNSRIHSDVNWTMLRKKLPKDLFEELCIEARRWGYKAPKQKG